MDTTSHLATDAKEPKLSPSKELNLGRRHVTVITHYGHVMHLLGAALC